MWSSFVNVIQIFTPLQMDKLQEEFTSYLLLQKSDIPDAIWKEAQVSSDKDNENVYYRMDKIWGFLSEVRECDGSLT